MVDFGKMTTSRAAMTTGAAILVALGAAGGAGAVKATRPTIEMAPTTQTPIARLATSDGVVTVRGKVAEVYGDRFVIQDGSGRAMVAAGREAPGTVSVGQPVMVQGRFDDGQLRASYLVDQNGSIAAVGPALPRPGPGGPGPHGGPGHDGPLPPPPPPPGCGPTPGGLRMAPPPVKGAMPSTPETVPPPPGAPQAPAAGQTLPSAAPTPPRS